MGGSELHAKHALGRVLLAFHPRLERTWLFCLLAPFFFFAPFFFSFSFSRSVPAAGGKTYGAVYLFWSGVGSHMSLADFHTSMTVV